MDKKYTKGPWSLNHNGYYFDINILRTDKKVINGSVFCNVSKDGSEYQPDQADQETKANAILISKAPEMLEMLEEISIRDEGSDEWLERVRNLIKSATEL